MLIGLAGAHSTGKTTLLNELKNDKRFASYTFITEVTRSLKTPINDDAEDYNETQRILINAHVKIIVDSKGKKVIVDRTMLDVYIYTLYLFLQRKVTFDTLNYVSSTFSAYRHKYDTVFYIKPEFDIVDDGVRSTKESFRNSIADLFETFIKGQVFATNIIKTLTGTVEERCLTMIRKIHDYD